MLYAIVVKLDSGKVFSAGTMEVTHGGPSGQEEFSFFAGAVGVHMLRSIGAGAAADGDNLGRGQGCDRCRHSRRCGGGDERRDTSDALRPNRRGRFVPFFGLAGGYV